MLLLLLAQMASTNPEVAALRFNFAMDAWSECIDQRVERLAETSSQPASKSILVHVAIEQCYVMSTDARRTFPDVVRKHLADEGVTSYGENVVDVIADEMFRDLSETMRERKIEQYAD